MKTWRRCKQCNVPALLTTGLCVECEMKPKLRAWCIENKIYVAGWIEKEGIDDFK